MPRRFFRKFALKRERLSQQWYLAPFAPLLQDPNLWGVRRRNVVPAVALGFFVAFLPFPGHIIAAALLALALRVNIPIAVLAVFIANPLTIGPMFYLAFEFGEWLLGMDPQPFEFEITMDWVANGFRRVWRPLLLGSVVLGAILSLTSYVVLDLIWRASVSRYTREKRRKRAAAEQQNDQSS